MSITTEKVGKFPTRLQPLTGVAKRGWAVIVEDEDGEFTELVEMMDFCRLHIVHDAFGHLTYGKSPAGPHDQWSFHEANGGGSVVLPYAVVEGKTYIGLLQEGRPLQTAEGKVWNVPRGFAEAGRSYLEVALAELGEEVGVIPEESRMRLLAGDPVNPNSAFFETWGVKSDGEPEGVRLFAYDATGLVEQSADGYKFRGAVSPCPGLGEKIYKCVFLPISVAGRVGDAMTLACLGRFLCDR